MDKPKAPLSRVINYGSGWFKIRSCPFCGSTMRKSGFLQLWGKLICDNEECRIEIRE